MTKIDMGLSGIRVNSVGIDENGIDLSLRAVHSRFWVAGALHLTDAQGSITWRPDEAGTSRATLRLVGGTVGATITSSVVESADSSFDLTFDSGLELHYDPVDDAPGELWQSEAPGGRGFLCTTPGPLKGEYVPDAQDEESPGDHEAEESATAGESPGATDGESGDRLIDLDLSLRIYGVTVFADALELLTRDGTIYFVGPFLLSSQGGDSIRFDPAEKVGDAATGAVLDRLVDSTIVLATIAPETSALSVQFDDGGVLQWEPPTAGMGKFRARHRSGWEFHSRGDGTVYWYGGPEGGHPKFLAGG